MEPNEEDLRVARDVIEAELGKRGTTGLEAQIGRQLDKLEIRIARALTEQRESIKSLLGRLPENSQVADCLDAIDGDTHLMD